MLDDDQRLRALRAAWELLVPGGRFVFDVFAPAADDIRDTHGRWLEREDGIFERADWDTGARTLTLSVRGDAAATTFTLAWLSPKEWHALLERVGFQVVACYGWFDKHPYRGGEDSVWIARRPACPAGPGSAARRARPGRRRRLRRTRPPGRACRAYP